MASKHDLHELVNLLMQDSILVPKALMAREDISEEAKIVFSVVLSKSLATNIEGFKKNISDLQAADIQSECCCDKPTAEKIKKELLFLLPQTEEIIMNGKDKMNFE